jgi:hypothetical protein
MRAPLARIICAAAILTSFTGCASTGFWKSNSGRFDKADADHPAVKIVCLWQTAEGRGLDNRPTRGFAGQILFLTQDSPTPVEVDGDVRIYLFDDQSPPEVQTKPIHQFDFTGGAWGNYLKKTAWGPTYQLFVPYTREGDFAARCELRVRLTPKAGPTVLSEPASISLPGPATEAAANTRPAPAGQPALLEAAQTAAFGPQEPRSRGPNLAPHQGPIKQFESYTVPQ